MKRYDEYKDTGIDWLPKLPSHWKLEQLRKYIRLVSKKGYPEKQLLSVTRELGVIIRDTESKEENHNFIPDDLSGYKYVKEGQFVINKMKSWQGSYGVSAYEGIVSPAYYVCDLDFPNKDFFGWAIRSRNYVSFFAQYSKGIRVGQWDLSPVALKSIPFFEPPLAEQEKIVRFLEDKTSKIDALLEKKGEQIKLLNELKESEIANIITRGLNPDVKMKDSGIPWIGMIPEHWEIKKISSLFKERREKVSDKVFQALSVSKQGITLQLETAVKTDKGDNRKKVCVGDFVVNSRSDRKGSCGISPFDGSVSLINIVLQPRNFIEGKFFHYLFRSNNYIEEYYRLGRGIVADLWTTRYSEMKNILVPLPPLEEQRAIVKCIEDKCKNSLISELEAEIEQLKEYKQKLIADCVTGQIDVRNM